MEVTETTPVEEPGVSTPDDTGVSGAPPSPVGDVEEFNRRVEKLMEMMENDPRVRDRILAELYVNFANVEMMFRFMVETLQKEGPAGFFKHMMGRKKK